MIQAHSLELFIFACPFSKTINTWPVYVHPSTQARTDHHADDPSCQAH